MLCVCVCVCGVFCVCVCVCDFMFSQLIDEDKSLLGYDVLICNSSPTFRSSLLPQSSGLSRNKLVGD